jgi:RNA polymerase sigma-70 factor (ECF subfamily)
MERLPVKYRTVVVARYLLDWSTQETAAALRIPEGTVKSRLTRALDRLAIDLEGGEL